MTTNTAATVTAEWAPPAAVELVGFRYNALNVSIHRITPQADGMELVEYIGREHPGRAAAMALLERAEATAMATGAREVTETDDRTRCGGRLVSITFYAGGPYAAPRRAAGLHRAPLTADPEQAALRARVTSTRGRWTQGQRVVVGELTSYTLVQNIPHDHRNCTCYSPVTTYAEGTVTQVTHYADNSVEAIVRLDNGTDHRVTLVAPHGDACF